MNVNVWIAEIWRAWRASLRRPGFLLLAVGVLALGMGAASAVFTMVDAVLLRPLPYPQAQQLAAVGPLDGKNIGEITPRQYQHLAGLAGVRSLGIYKYKDSSPPVNIAGGGVPLQVPSLYVDRGLLPTLGIRLALGRNFSAEEDHPDGPPAVILSHGFWQRRFGGDPGVIGRSLQVEGVAHAIVGVLPATFALSEGDVVLPTAFRADSQDDGANYVAVARLDDGIDPSALAPRVHARLHAMYADQGERGDGMLRQRFGAQDLRGNLHAGQRATSLMWMACALFVLLIALVNLTNLMLLRTLSRSHEASVRGALGASLWRLALPSLAEGVLVGAGGVLLGQALAAAGLLVLQRLMPVDWMPIEWTLQGALHLGPAEWLLAGAVGVFGALLAAGLGVWRGRRAAASMDELREGGRSGLSLRSGRLGRRLVVAQMALATALLCAAGLFLHSLLDASKVDLGFDPKGVLTFELAPVKATYPDAAAVQRLSQRLLDRLRLLPGVADAAATTNLPAGDVMGQFGLDWLAPGGDAVYTQFRGVSPNFFDLFGIRMRDGRAFAPTDGRGGEQVAIVNKVLADRVYGGHALGKLIQRGVGKDRLSARIVGVVADTYQYGPLDPGSIQPIVYLPLAQMPDDAMRSFRSFEPMRFALKVHGDPDAYRQGIVQAVAEVAPDQPIARVRSMQYVIANDTLSDTYFNLLLIGLFAGLALLLAAVGMYAVMAVAVAAREREFGVRSALGAPPLRLVVLVLRAGLTQIAWGLVGGIALAFASAGVLRAVIEALGRRAFDPWAMGATCVALACAGLLACLAPALRAGRVHPMRALRGE